MTTNSKHYLSKILIYAERKEDVQLHLIFGVDDVEDVGLPQRLGIDEFPLVKQQMIFLLEIEEEVFDRLFGPKLHRTHTIKNIKALLNGD